MSASDFDVFDQLENLSSPPEDSIQEISPKDPIQEGTTCVHPNTTLDDLGVCTCDDCGVEVKKTALSDSKMYTATDNRSLGDGNRCWAPKKKLKSIRDDLKGLGFSDAIVNETYSIFRLVTKDGIFRVDKRKSILLACLQEAHKNLKCPVSLESLLEKMPIGAGNITIGMRLLETKIKKYDLERSRVTYTSPVDSIQDLLSKWDSDSKTIEEIIRLYHKIDDKSSLLNRSRAKSVAAGLIYYYALATKRTNIKLKEFSKKVELSESTITKLAKEISAILSTPEVLVY